MAPEAIVAAGADVAEAQLETVIRRRLGLPAAEPQKKPVLEAL